VLMGWAVQDNEFFQQIADIVTFRTSRGQLNLPEYLRQTGSKIYYVTRELGSLQEQLLGEGYGVPVLDASWFSVAPFLRRYARQHPDIQLVQLDGESNQLLQPVEEENFRILLDFYKARAIRARVVSFKPEDVPAIIMYPKDAEFIRETRSALDSGELPGPFAGLISDYLGRIGSDGSDELEGTLYLNAACTLVQELPQTANSPVRESALILIYHIARLFSGRMLDTQQIAAAFRETADVIKTLVLRP
jgi:molecular chaperone HtpG